MINVLVQFREDLLLQIRGLLGQETPEPQSPLFDSLYLFKDMMDFDRPDNWWAEETQGQNRFVTVDLILPNLESVQELENLPGGAQRVNVIRVIDKNGVDVVDPETEQPVYPDLSDTVLGVRQLYDVDGNPTTTEPMTFTQHPQWLGWKRI